MLARGVQKQRCTLDIIVYTISHLPRGPIGFLQQAAVSRILSGWCLSSSVVALCRHKRRLLVNQVKLDMAAVIVEHWDDEISSPMVSHFGEIREITI